MDNAAKKQAEDKYTISPFEFHDLEKIVKELGWIAFQPDEDANNQGPAAAARAELEILVEKYADCVFFCDLSFDTWSLTVFSSSPAWRIMIVLLSIIKPGQVDDWLRLELTRILALCPLKPDGVRATLEIIFSKCAGEAPQLPESNAPDKRGSGITPEAIASAAKLLSKVPRSMTPTAWFTGLRPQLFSMLDGHEGSEFVKVAAHIIGHILSLKPFGPPGEYIHLTVSTDLCLKSRIRGFWLDSFCTSYD